MAAGFRELVFLGHPGLEFPGDGPGVGQDALVRSGRLVVFLGGLRAVAFRGDEFLLRREMVGQQLAAAACAYRHGAPSHCQYGRTVPCTWWTSEKYRSPRKRRYPRLGRRRHPMEDLAHRGPFQGQTARSKERSVLCDQGRPRHGGRPLSGPTERADGAQELHHGFPTLQGREPAGGDLQFAGKIPAEFLGAGITRAALQPDGQPVMILGNAP
ncbi:hypothetical protein B0G38_000487 [Arthrobacter sp. VKM Ac-2550]|nr:hypothetical protein [Arthrobacter sp. VKM Ac-2550]